MSFVAAEIRRREQARIAEQHRAFLATREPGVRDTINNLAKFQSAEKLRESAPDGWRALR